MKEITFKLENIYKVYSKMIEDKNLVLAEKNIIEIFNGKTLRTNVASELELQIDKGFLNKVITNEIIRKLIIKESTISTSTIEGEIIDEDTFEKANADLNSIQKEKRTQYSSILSLADMLDRYVFPKNISSDDIKYIHNKVFADRKYNPGNFKSSDNFVNISKSEKLMYISTSEVDVELNKLFEFMNDEDTDKNPIIKASLLHMYLALIHPFTDGNGRIIRILLNKYLSKVLGKEIYLDKYILDNIKLYKSNLNSFRSDSINEKNKFPNFLIQLLIQYNTDHNMKLIDSYGQFIDVNLILKKSNLIPETKIKEISLFIIKNKMFTISSMEYDLGISRITASKYARILIDLKIYKEDSKNKKSIFIRNN